jgi:hypothetical protein
VAAEHVLRAASVGNNGGWPVALRRLPTRAAAATLFLNGPHAHRPHQPTNPQGNSEIHKFQRPISTENPMMALFLLPFCASDMRHYPKKACGWTNNDHQKRRPFVSVLAVLGIRKKQKYCCNVRANVSCGDATLARCVYTVWAAESQRR